MPDRLKLTKNTQLYTPKNPTDDSIINDILDAAIENMANGEEFVVNIFRVDRTVDEPELVYKYSTRVFPTVRPVYFIDEEIEDRVFAFIVLIEYQNYLAIFKKSCANISDLLKENFTLINSSGLRFPHLTGHHFNKLYPCSF